MQSTSAMTRCGPRAAGGTGTGVGAGRGSGVEVGAGFGFADLGFGVLAAGFGCDPVLALVGAPGRFSHGIPSWSRSRPLGSLGLACNTASASDHVEKSPQLRF